jgi:uncharacterized repeat protein (TIGR03803 family)
MSLHKLQSASRCVIVGVLLTLIIAGPTPAAAKETVLYTFTGGSDGNGVISPLIFDDAGNLYGTTASGGASGAGTVFELAPSAGGWMETVLYSFLNGGDGANPYGPLVFDKEGNLYGITYGGGASGFGTAFELSPNSGDGWTKTTIYSFAGGRDGNAPFGGLISDSGGNLYGFTLSGGAGSCNNGLGCGTVFELKRSQSSWKEVVVFRFPGGNGGSLPAGLTLGRSGNLYGVTSQGGNAGVGLVFKLSHSAGQWNESILHAFTGGSDGSTPQAGVTLDGLGNLYGTTFNGSGGGCDGGGCGLVYELKPVGKGKWKELVLHRFTDNAHDGSYPGTTLIFDPKGNLFGTTCCGAAYGDGVVFELMRNFDGEWKESVIQDFFGGDYGYSPGALLLGKNGNLYGPAGGGLYGAGLVFELNP